MPYRIEYSPDAEDHLRVLTSIENVDWETVTLSTDPQFLALIKQSRERQKAEGGISAAELRRRLGLTPATQGESQP